MTSRLINRQKGSQIITLIGMIKMKYLIKDMRLIQMIQIQMILRRTTTIRKDTDPFLQAQGSSKAQSYPPSNLEAEELIQILLTIQEAQVQ